ncbi:MAG: hypothetical protein E7647_00390 [Ruminococcaceae bacterium]|nr:hypothetical protein [Oscillospiraceae bacterium]
MDKRKRLEYLLVTAILFVSGFMIYGLLGCVQPFINNNRILSFFAFGALGGFSFSLILSTIILSARFFAKKSLAFKVVCAVLWPITFACCFYACFFMYIPYDIYNIVMLIKKEPRKTDNNVKE